LSGGAWPEGLTAAAAKALAAVLAAAIAASSGLAGRVPHPPPADPEPEPDPAGIGIAAPDQRVAAERDAVFPEGLVVDSVGAAADAEARAN
jgi:hypothetical protein